MLKIKSHSIFFVNIKSSFSCLPNRIISNLLIAKDFENQNKCSSDIANSIFRHTGILERRYASDGEAASDLAIQAINSSNIDKNKVGALLVATSSGDFPSPATATFVHRGLQLHNSVHCLDVASSCSSFLSALRSSIGFLATNLNPIVIASEVKHKGLSQDDLRTKSLFADGAGGVYLENVHNIDRQEFLIFCYQETKSNLSRNICTPVGGSKEPTTIYNIHRNKLEFTEPKMMYLQTVKAIVEATEKCWLERNIFILENFKEKNIKIPCTIYIHQANNNIIKDVKQKLRKEISENIPTLMADIGNMVCASLPVLRTRILFLKSIFCFDKKKVSKRALLETFISICQQSHLFSYEICSHGINFKTNYINEEITIFDAGAQKLEESWLTKISEEECNEIMNIFENELHLSKESQPTQSLDIWIAAGGGFQTVGVLHGNLIFQK